MGLDRREGVLSHVVDLAIGAVAAAVAWWLYKETGQAIWSLLLLLATAGGMVWLRLRGYRESDESETQAPGTGSQSGEDP